MTKGETRIDFDVRELTALTATLARASAKAVPAAVATVAATAGAVEATMRQMCSSQRVAATIRTDREDPLGLSLSVGPTHWIAHFVEGGTAATSPRPYAGPAADAHADGFASALAAAAAASVL